MEHICKSINYLRDSTNMKKCRDRQIASALGKPMMIQDVDCDVEPITLDDFDEEDSIQSRQFFIEQCKLAGIRTGHRPF